jgi:hypothetical protein
MIAPSSILADGVPVLITAIPGFLPAGELAVK